MFPTKSMFETSEMNRIFSQSIENDAASHYSSLFQSPVANRSSSSAESVSPENYFDLPFQFNRELIQARSRVLSPSPPKQYYSPFQDFSFESTPYKRQDPFTRSPQIYESPRSYHDSEISTWHHRPIIGRKILGGTSQVKTKEKSDSNLSLDFLHDSFTPPNSHPKSYELFPKTEEREVNYFLKTPSSISSLSNTVNIPPRSRSTSVNHTNIRPHNTNYSPFKMPISANSQISQGKICTFCRKNGETPMVYGNHLVKENIGGKYIVTCPILRSHRCETCGVSGDDAHTITYCPVLRSTNDGRPLTSTTIKLKNTRIKSNGRRRY